MGIHRIHIRPTGGHDEEDFARSFAYCLSQGVLGVGWQVTPKTGQPLSWEEYEKLATAKYGLGELSRVRYLHDAVKGGDLLWTRDTQGKYFLAKVEPSPAGAASGEAWEYLDTEEGRASDVVNVVRCRILPVPNVDDVPGKIVACFRPTRAIQSIVNETAVLYSKLLWNQLAAQDEFTIPVQDPDLFVYLDSESTEDVIFVFLQREGWIVIPNSRKADTMGYEFISIHSRTHERAVVQVKTGNTALDASCWAAFSEKVFLFQAHGLYTGVPTGNVVLLAPKAIAEFVQSNLDIMPRNVRRWAEFARTRARA